MHFRNYKLQKTWLVKCLKSLFSEHPSTFSKLNGPNPAEICTTAFLSYLLSLGGKWDLKISLLLIYEILGLFVNTLTRDDKHSPCNSENIPQSIQMQLSKSKEKNTSIFC